MSSFFWKICVYLKFSSRRHLNFLCSENVNKLTSLHQYHQKQEIENLHPFSDFIVNIIINYKTLENIINDEIHVLTRQWKKQIKWSPY